jgi:hypothetical protein
LISTLAEETEMSFFATAAAVLNGGNGGRTLCPVTTAPLPVDRGAAVV